MKKVFVYIGILVIVILARLALAQNTFVPIYSITGKVDDHVNFKADGNKIVIYRTDAELHSGIYAYDIIGPTGSMGTSNRYLINVTDQPFFWNLAPGQKFKVATMRNEAGYGAGPVEVTISGNGYDTANLSMTFGGGVTDIPEIPNVELPKEPAPTVKLWFGNRLYQPEIYWKEVEGKITRPFVVAAKPEMKVELSIEAPYTLAKEMEAYTITIDQGTPQAKVITLTSANVTGKTYAAGTAAKEEKIASMSLKYTFEEELSEGQHLIQVSGKSSGTIGTASLATYLATVEVMGGPLRVIGVPITFPSPFSITKHGKVYIQYELSKDANIILYLVSPVGTTIKKWDIPAGAEGGSAGLNKVEWNGRTDQGYLAGNAIYGGTIISKDDNRLLGKFKLTIVD